MEEDQRPPPQAPLLARPPPRLDHVRARTPGGDHLGNELRGILEIAVHYHGRIGGGCRETRGNRRLLTEVPRRSMTAKRGSRTRWSSMIAREPSVLPSLT